MLYFPFAYTFLTRNRTIPYKIAYLMTYIVPVMIIMYYYRQLNIFGLVALTGTVSIYEIGYIENDNVTISYEQTPTIRLRNKDQKWIQRRLPILSSVRRLYAFLAAFILYISGCRTVWLYMFLLVGLDVIYGVHNVIRSRWNCLTIGMLTFLKYLTPIIICAAGVCDIVNMSIVILVLCSTVRSVEHANKYHVFSSILLVKYDYFRMGYYLVVFLISLGIWAFSKEEQLLLFLSAYFLIYRILCVIFIRRKEKYNMKEKGLK